MSASTNKPVVEIYEKDVYGNTLIYPANNDARTFAVLAGKKTHSKQDLELISLLGFEVKRVFAPRDDTDGGNNV